jgi:radical SAM superfamily enzyme YgiQ (UPF0313 family)
MKPRIMFINAINPTIEMEACLPPLGLGYLVSSLRKEFGQKSIKFKIVNQEIEQEINSFKPDLVGITSVSQNYNRAIKYAQIAKKYDLPVIIGGTHISLLPSSLTSDMDVAVIGEGEETIVDLFNLFEKEGNFERVASLKRIDGIAFRNNGKLILTKRRKLIEPLDKIPLPARDLLDIDIETYMFSSRGCPYRCVFCASSRFWAKVRFFSAEYVINEIEHLTEKYGVKNIIFYDDLFIADKKRVRRISELLKKKDILGRVSFHCSARADLIDDEIVRLLKQMNFKRITLGLESGCSSTLRYLKANTVKVKDNMNAVKTIKRYGITCYSSFIIGSPQETKKDILSTLKFIEESQLDDFHINILTPLPGTPIWEYAKKRNLVSEDMNWEKLNIRFAENYEKAVILSEKLTRKELYELFLQFQKLRKRRRLKYIIKEGWEKPWKISKFLIKKLRSRLPMFTLKVKK